MSHRPFICIHTWIFVHSQEWHVVYCSEWGLHIHEWVMAHIWMSHGTYMNESWHIYEWVMAHIGMSHVTQAIYIHTCIFIHSQEWHIVHRSEWGLHINEWVMAHIGISHVKQAIYLYSHVNIHTFTGMTHCSSFWVGSCRWPIANAIRCAYFKYGVATISRLLKIIGLFCKRAL